MHTIVFQSFRTSDVPMAIRRSLASVAAWADLRRYDYQFLDDDLFAQVPDNIRLRLGEHPLPLSDIARLLKARDFLRQGYERAIWADADIVVFDPEHLEIRVTSQYAFCREVWVRRGGRGQYIVTDGLHNAMCVFCQGNDMLDFYIHACQSLAARTDREYLPHSFGPDLLGRLQDIIGDRILREVGLFSPVVTADIAKGGGKATRAYAEAFAHPVRAANLCLSFFGRSSSGVRLTDRVVNAAIDRLLETKGEVINCYQSGVSST